MKVTVRVPATSANLGPGFDCFGLALDLCNEVTVDTEAEPGVSWEGEGADELPTDGSDMVSRGIATTLEQQVRHHPGAAIPSFAMHGVNRIPLERGLGSSSAAAVAGVAIAGVLLGQAGFDPSDPDVAYTMFAYAAQLEGHPDNAAPAAFGGLTVIADGFVAPMQAAPRPAAGGADPGGAALDGGRQGCPAGPGVTDRRGLQRRPRGARGARADAGSRPPPGGAAGPAPSGRAPRARPRGPGGLPRSRPARRPGLRLGLRADARWRSSRTTDRSRTRARDGGCSGPPCGRPASRSSR